MMRALLSFTLVIWLCSPCFADDPKHHSQNTTLECEKCHSVNGWSPATFDHSKIGFPLRGRHQYLNCSKCHITGDFEKPVDRLCEKCHNDVHLGKLGKICQKCHNESAWKNSFTIEQHRRTNFPLLGSHALIPCVECHMDIKGQSFSRASTQCFSCHQSEYASTATSSINHMTAGFGTRCQDCHRSTQWSPSIGFRQHDTCFPISTGHHSGIACKDCHTSTPSISSLGGCNSGTFFCGDCHQGTHSQSRMNKKHDDVPGYQFVDQKCYECHRNGR
ncbi:MAG: cytochrome C [Deltaproteobacteria bacterium]|nr:cytochrome C [Deltaproteobacteria bacterium]